MDKLLNNDMLALYEESNISLGEILLQSSEGYVDYLASALKYSDTAMKTINMTNISKLLAVDQLQEIPYGQAVALLQLLHRMVICYRDLKFLLHFNIVNSQEINLHFCLHA